MSLNQQQDVMLLAESLERLSVSDSQPNHHWCDACVMWSDHLVGFSPCLFCWLETLSLDNLRCCEQKDFFVGRRILSHYLQFSLNLLSEEWRFPFLPDFFTTILSVVWSSNRGRKKLGRWSITNLLCKFIHLKLSFKNGLKCTIFNFIRYVLY